MLFALLAFTATAHASDWSKATYFDSKPALHAAAIDPIYKQIFDSVSQQRVTALLQQLTGYATVTVDGRSFLISERFSDQGKANFRAFWLDYFKGLGIPVQELTTPTGRGGSVHNTEAVLAGKSKDSIVIIVHYDSMGPRSNPTGNPAVDDDMTGMATAMETARVLAEHKGQLQKTVRFVAADLEEQGGLAGARDYARYIKSLAQNQGFQISGAIDNEQSGWDCNADGGCGFSGGTGDGPTPVDVFSCSGDGMGYDYPAMGDALSSVATEYGGMQVTRGCIGENSDHYAMWEIGVPSVVFSEHDPFENPHFDEEGGDTFDKIAKDYYFKISRIGVTFAAKLAGLSAQ
jgi:hypothetical protein